jgi:hypothetical protein
MRYKRLVLRIDKFMLKLMISRLIYNFRFRVNSNLFSNRIQRSMTVYIDKNNFSEFALLCEKYGSDKGGLEKVFKGEEMFPWPVHTYADLYERLFYQSRNNILNVLECGIGTTNINIESNMSKNGSPGASLRVLRDYFPNAQVVGLDIDENVMFSDERIKTYVTDQTSSLSIQATLKLIGPVNFDLVIDDGLHTYMAAKTLFKNLESRLSETFIYIIEDVREFYFSEFQELSKSKYIVDFVKLERNKGLHIKRGDNNLVIIRRRNAQL